MDTPTLLFLTDTFSAALEHQRAQRPGTDALIARSLPLVRLAACHQPELLGARVDALVALAGADAAEPVALLAASLARAEQELAAARLVRAARGSLARAFGPGSATVARLSRPARAAV